MINFWRFFLLVGGLCLVLLSSLMSLSRRETPQSFIVFSSDRTGVPSIFSVGRDGSQLTHLTPHFEAGCFTYFAPWSPNGLWLLTRCRADNKDVLVRLEPWSQSVLLFNPPEMIGGFKGWSPDSRTLFFAFSETDTTALLGRRANGTDLGVLKSDTVIYAPIRWSPDKRWGAFIDLPSLQKDGEVNVISPNGQTIHSLATVMYGNEVGWSADSQWVIFGARLLDEPNGDIYRARWDGSDLTNLTQTPTEEEYLVAVSPDGAWLAYQVAGAVYTMRLDGSQRTPVATSSLPFAYVGWSPQGTWLQFSMFKEGQEDIFIVRPDGTDLTNLSQHAAIDFPPQWSPDEQWLVFMSNREGEADVFRLRPDGSAWLNLTANLPNTNYVIWSPDGEWLVISTHANEEYDIYTLEVATGIWHDVSQSSSVDTNPTWSPVVKLPWRGAWVLLGGFALLIVSRLKRPL